MIVTPGTQDVSVYFYLQDAVTGGPHTVNPAPVTDFNLIYQRDGVVQVVSNCAGILAAANSVHADNQIFHCGNGIWRVDWPDAVFAAASDHAQLIVTHDDGDFIPRPREVDLSMAEVVAAALLTGNVDSTGAAGGLSLAKALEVATAFAMGQAEYNPATQTWSIYGRDGATVIAQVRVLGQGNREDSLIP